MRTEYAARLEEELQWVGTHLEGNFAPDHLFVLGDIIQHGETGPLEAAVTTVETNPRDTVGGVYMIRQARGTVTNVDGRRWAPDDTILVASNGTRHDVVLEAVRQALDRP